MPVIIVFYLELSFFKQLQIFCGFIYIEKGWPLMASPYIDK